MLGWGVVFFRFGNPFAEAKVVAALVSGVGIAAVRCSADIGLKLLRGI